VYAILDNKSTKQDPKLGVSNKQLPHHFQKWRRHFEFAGPSHTVGNWEQEPAYWLVQGLTYLNMEAPIAALQAFNFVLEHSPQDLVALIHKHDALVMMGYFKEALQQIEQVLALVPYDFRALRRLADHRSSRGLVWDEEGKQTKFLIKKAIKLAPDAADVYESLAYYHLRRGEWKEATALLKTFVEQHPNHPQAWHYYARCLFRTGDFQAAAKIILKAYVLYQNDYDIYQSICEILPKVDRLEELHFLVEEMLERFPERWSIWVTAGRVLVKNFKDDKRGCIVSAQGPKLQPQLACPWFLHGYVLTLANKYREAVSVLESGWERLSPKDSYLQAVPAAVLLGDVYQILGDKINSQIWWERASNQVLKLISFNPPIAYYWQGRVLTTLGDVPGAIRTYHTALNYHLFFPLRQEVKKSLKCLRSLTQKGNC
jgi:tetratricopeptide (TPR) repeat protein